MKNEASKALDPELVTVLRIVARMNLAKRSTIAQQAGGSALEALHALCKREYIREHAARQRDGTASCLYSLTAKGQEALNAIDEQNSTNTIPTVASPPSRPSTGTYDGSEMRPFAGRPGAMDAFKYPSRVGRQLFHPDGSVTPIK